MLSGALGRRSASGSSRRELAEVYYPVTDGVTDEQFDAATGACKDEGNRTPSIPTRAREPARASGDARCIT